MKKLLLLLFILITSITFVSCDSKTTNETTNVTTTDQTTLTTEISTTLGIDYTGIEITNQTDKFFDLNEDFDKDSLELTAFKSDGSSEIISSDLYQIRGYDSTSAGTKNLTIIFDRYMVETTVYILEDYAFEIEMDFYMSTLNLEGNTLKSELYNIINDGFVGLLYGDARNLLQESDEDPDNTDNIILVYTGYSVDSTWDSGDTWNREHVWPQSRLGVSVSYYDDFPSKATDLHNLKPADPSENTSRSNDYFSTQSGSDFYTPRDEVKGDIARILFYMATMYVDLSLNDDETSKAGLKTMGTLSMLLEWNELDPVDDFEMNRNEVIYSHQGNRNPFIDYPEYANLIWGDN